MNDVIISSKRGLFEVDISGIYRYRSLLRMFVYRDFVTYYKQTILGPLWFLIQPIFHAGVHLFVFGNLAGLGPEGVPGFLFYLSGPILWQYFQDSFTKTSAIFVDNQHLFGKVYFPRLIMPLTVLLSGLMKLGIQLVLLVLAIVFYYYDGGYIGINTQVVLVIPLILLVMLLSLGFGLIVSAVTTKYRDFKFLIDFSIPLLRYVTPGIATTMAMFKSEIPPEMSAIVKYNPFGYVIDAFNAVLVGAGEIDVLALTYVSAFAIALIFVGVLAFNQTEKNFMDTV